MRFVTLAITQLVKRSPTECREPQPSLPKSDTSHSTPQPPALRGPHPVQRFGTHSGPFLPLLTAFHFPFDCDWQILCSIVLSCRLWWRHTRTHMHRNARSRSCILGLVAADRKFCRSLIRECICDVSFQPFRNQGHDCVSPDVGLMDVCKLRRAEVVRLRGTAGGGGERDAQCCLKSLSLTQLLRDGNQVTFSHYAQSSVCVWEGWGWRLETRPWPLYIHQPIIGRVCAVQSAVRRNVLMRSFCCLSACIHNLYVSAILCSYFLNLALHLFFSLYSD